MKSTKLFLGILMLTLMSVTAIGQDFQVPKNYKLAKNEDFAKYEKDIIACVNWLETSPLNKEPEKRKEANAFLLSWITGSPTVSVGINANIVNFNENNPELLMIFMGGWTRSVLESKPQDNDQVKGNVAGLRSVIKVYKMGNGIVKDKKIEKLFKLEEGQELNKYVEEQLKKK
jgi:hypothetical protein